VWLSSQGTEDRLDSGGSLRFHHDSQWILK
jgi:hypothetical protein